jgi:hypothetical protein
MYACMYLFIYCKWTQVRLQNYLDINEIQVKINFISKILKDIVCRTQFTTLPYYNITYTYLT